MYLDRKKSLDIHITFSALMAIQKSICHLTTYCTYKKDTIVYVIYFLCIRRDWAAEINQLFSIAADVRIEKNCDSCYATLFLYKKYMCLCATWL